jgi:hypothetical protein
MTTSSLSTRANAAARSVSTASTSRLW